MEQYSKRGEGDKERGAGRNNLRIGSYIFVTFLRLNSMLAFPKTW